MDRKIIDTILPVSSFLEEYQLMIKWQKEKEREIHKKV